MTMFSNFRRAHSDGQQEAAERIYEQWDLRPEPGSSEDRIARRAFIHGWQARYDHIDLPPITSVDLALAETLRGIRR